jgi:Fur family zinc uptake transcriptional regulator
MNFPAFPECCETLLKDHGLRVTAPRLAVLRDLIGKTSPRKAYDILESLSSPGKEVNPPTVYRALSSLEEAGIVHRIESLNAYVFCPGHAKGHDGQHELFFAICDACGHVNEIEQDMRPSLSTILRKQGFMPSRRILEIHGICSGCQSKG